MENIDQQEVHKFDELSHDWWDKDGSFKTLHDINKIRLDYITQKIQLKDKVILDVGCGGGLLAEAMAELGAKVTGIDAASKAIQTAKLHKLENNLTITYKNTTIENFIHDTNETFDIITCLELLEHVPHPQALIEDCASILKPNGFLFLSTINRNAMAYLQTILGAEYCLKILPRGTHDYEKFITPSELSAWVRRANLTLCDIQGMKYNPFTRQARLSNNCQVNYIVHCQRQS